MNFLKNIFANIKKYRFLLSQLVIRDFKVTENFDGSYINNATCTKFINMLKEKLGLSNIGNLYLSRKDLENIMDYEI